VAFVTFSRNYQCGPAITLDDPRGGDSNHAAMPAVSVNYDAESIVQRRVVNEAGVDRIQNATLFLLTLSIELIQPVRDLFRPRGIFYTEKLDNVASHVHASCR